MFAASVPSAPSLSADEPTPSAPPAVGGDGSAVLAPVILLSSGDTLCVSVSFFTGGLVPVSVSPASAAACWVLSRSLTLAGGNSGDCVGAPAPALPGVLLSSASLAASSCCAFFKSNSNEILLIS